MASNNTPAEQPKKVKTNCLTGFVNDYVPDNEQTYNFAIPIIGFASSCISFGIFMTYLQNIKYGEFINHTMYNYGYMVLTGASSVDLYYGLRNRNRKQYFFWIVMKIIEMILIITAVVGAFVKRVNIADFVSVGIVLIVIKVILLYYMFKRARSKQNRSVIPEENMYDLPHSPTQTNIYSNEVY